MKIHLRHRPSADGNHATIWLIERSGAAESGLLHGEMSADRAAKLLAVLGAMGIPCEQDAALALPIAEAGQQAVLQRQATLFDAFADGEAS